MVLTYEPLTGLRTADYSRPKLRNVACGTQGARKKASHCLPMNNFTVNQSIGNAVCQLESSGQPELRALQQRLKHFKCSWLGGLHLKWLHQRGCLAYRCCYSSAQRFWWCRIASGGRTATRTASRKFRTSSSNSSSRAPSSQRSFKAWR